MEIAVKMDRFQILQISLTVKYTLANTDPNRTKTRTAIDLLQKMPPAF